MQALRVCDCVVVRGLQGRRVRWRHVQTAQRCCFHFLAFPRCLCIGVWVGCGGMLCPPDLPPSEEFEDVKWGKELGIGGKFLQPPDPPPFPLKQGEQAKSECCHSTEPPNCHH